MVFTETGKEEMKFIAVILNMGIIQLNDLKDYWSTDDSTNLPFFHLVFSCDCFFQIFGALHVRNLEGTTKQGEIQPFLHKICPSLEAALLQVNRLLWMNQSSPSRDECHFGNISKGSQTLGV